MKGMLPRNMAGYNGDNSCQSPLKSYTFIGIALWMTNQRKTTSLCTLCLCQMVLHLGEVGQGISCYHLLWMHYLRAFWVVIHFWPSVAEYVREGVTSSHHQCVESNKKSSIFPKNMIYSTWALPHDSLSTLPCDIHPRKTMGGVALLAFVFTSVRLKYCDQLRT